MDAPKHLKHKPLFSVNDYHKNDGHFKSCTDAKALSIGLAQYNPNEISLKVWRHTDTNWSRQSEELPIHRNLDLTIVFLSIVLAKKSPNTLKSRLDLQEMTSNGYEQVNTYYEKHRSMIDERLQEIKELLKLITP
jgi:hypothetical protein